jgi:hypothetical protein
MDLSHPVSGRKFVMWQICHLQRSDVSERSQLLWAVSQVILGVSNTTAKQIEISPRIVLFSPTKPRRTPCLELSWPDPLCTVLFWTQAATESQRLCFYYTYV